jgi:hypothetical protein
MPGELHVITPPPPILRILGAREDVFTAIAAQLGSGRQGVQTCVGAPPILHLLKLC